MTNTTKLYCMHAIGPDEVHAAPSLEAAQKAAAWHTQRFAATAEKLDVMLRFEAAEWPHSAESHAEDMKKWFTHVVPNMKDQTGKPFAVGDVVIHKTLKTRMAIVEIDMIRIVCEFMFGWTKNSAELMPDQIEHEIPLALEPVTSSNLSAVGYNESQQQLHVRFSNGKTWAYMGVPPEVVSAMRSAASIGSFFAREIKPRFNGVDLAPPAIAPSSGGHLQDDAIRL